MARPALTAISVMAWTCIVLLSLGWAVTTAREQTHDLAVNSARASFDKDLAYRMWATSHGGVYVQPDERTPPSPYLSHLPNRDVVTTEGMGLTLMNPAYMLRQMMEEYPGRYGSRGQLVGIVTLNPNNRADAWQEAAIHKFEQGVTEIVEVTTTDGEQRLRLIAPFMMEPGCMKCHGHLGFNVGDVRGAVEVAVPMAPFQHTEQHTIRTALLSHLGIWLLGLGGILASLRLSAGHSREREQLLAKEVALSETLQMNIDELSGALAIQQTLVDEINHRVGNHLSTLIALVDAERVQAEQTESTHMLTRIESRIRGLSSVHVLLAKTSWRPVPARDLIETVVRETCRGSWPEPQLSFEGTGSPLTNRQSPHVAIALSELCINALKHHAPDQTPVIHVSIADKNDTIVLVLRDRGPGYPESIVAGEPIIGRRGLALVRAIVEHSLGGQLSFKNLDGAMTEIIIPIERDAASPMVP